MPPRTTHWLSFALIVLDCWLAEKSKHSGPRAKVRDSGFGTATFLCLRSNKIVCAQNSLQTTAGHIDRAQLGTRKNAALSESSKGVEIP